MKPGKKLYKIMDKTTGSYISLGYQRRSTWLVFPSAALENSSIKKDEYKNYEIHVFESVMTKTLTLDGKEI